MLTVTSGVARVGDVEIAYDTRGSGEPLLLIAGFGMTRAMGTTSCATLSQRAGSP